MKQAESVVGQRYGYLTVISASFMKKYPKRNVSFVKVECDCGQIKDVNFRDLKANKIKSCGCQSANLVGSAIKTHGLTNNPLYEVWASMKKRCDNPNCNSYRDYGGRGISYQDSWGTFENFYLDMFDGYAPNLELDRRDVNGNYTKENCRWVESGINAHNRRKRKGSKCASIGVCMKGDKFRATLTFEGILVLRKSFLLEYDAALAYDDASEEYYGDRPNKTIRVKIPNEV